MIRGIPEEIQGVVAHPHFRWVRPIQQARSQLTFERLLDSAETLIAEKGFADVPVADIARRAGVSVGAFYSRFRDKEALLHCLQDRFVAEARATADVTLEAERWRGASIAEIGREAIAFMVEIHREREGILRELLGRTHTDPALVERKERLIAYICERLQPLLLERRQEISHPDPEVATGFAFRLLLGGLKEAILFGAPDMHGIPRTDDALGEELTRAFLGYLGVPQPV